MNSPQKSFAATAALLMALAVVLGALGAHALEGKLSADQLDSYHTGVRYHAWHAIALLLIQVLPEGFASAKTRVWCSRLMVAGILCFSFSIYLLSLRELLHIEGIASFLGPVTPIGGLLLIASWLWLAIGIVRR